MEIMIRLPRRSQAGFTLIEMLTVVVVMTILMGLTIGITKGVMESSRKAKATGEINGYALALERFETDNGFIPPNTQISKAGSDYSGNPRDVSYRLSSAALFLALTGRQVYNISNINSSTKEELGKSYIEPKINQVFTDGNSHNTGAKSWILDSYTASGVVTDSQGALKDPWGFPYGYFYDSEPDNPGQNSLHNSTSYDLWSTGGGTKDNSKIILKWITNWQQN